MSESELIAALGRPSILAATAFGEVVRQCRAVLGLDEGESLVAAIEALKRAAIPAETLDQVEAWAPKRTAMIDNRCGFKGEWVALPMEDYAGLVKALMQLRAARSEESR